MAKTLLAPALFLFLASSFLGAQGVVAIPTWYSDPADGVEFVPPEYSGAHAGNVGHQFRTRSGSVRSSTLSAKSSTESGVIFVRDLRTGASTSRFGWDTGLARVHSISRWKSDSLLICGWHAASSTSVLRVLSAPSTGGTSQTSLGASSQTSVLWTGASRVGTAVYIYDVSGHRIIRQLDVDGDGVVDATDPLLSISIPQDPGTHDVAAAALPLRGFSKLTSGLVSIVSDSEGGFAAFDPAMGSAATVSVLRPTDSGRKISFASALRVGQQRLLVYGTPATEFVVESRSAGTVTQVSKRWSLPQSGSLVVSLTTAIGAIGTEVRVRETAAGASTPLETSWRKVNRVQGPQLFPQVPIRLQQEMEKLTLYGDGLSSNFEYLCDTGSALVVLKVRKFSNGGMVTIILPDLGATGKGNPGQKLSLCRIWARDATTNARLTNSISLDIRHN